MSVTDRAGEFVEEIGPERGWLALVGTVLAALVGGTLLFPRLVWDGFLWHYLWGPVYADANSAECAVMTDGGPRLVTDPFRCDSARVAGRIVAEPGYTLVSEVVYALTLLVALVGVYFMLRRLDVGNDRRFLYGLVPFVLFGGALRVVEDALDTAGEVGASLPIAYPWNTLLISPLIYFTVFFLTLATLLVALWLDRSGRLPDYHRTLAAGGTAILAVTVGYLGWLAVSTGYVTFHPTILLVVLVGATAVTGLAWVGVERYRPAVNAGTGRLGIVVIWGHMIDAVANVVGIDWGAELGLPYGDLRPKHPVNDAMIGLGEWVSATVADFTGAVGLRIVPADLIGTAWPFLLLKVGAVLFILSLFNEEIFEDSPRYAILFLVAVVAVGLGPGTRDMLRATFGV